MNVSRYVNVKELKFTVDFITPCFLGGADGNAAVRSAPFKNLIRRWWRVVNGELSPDDLWKKESRLFGSTEKEPDSSKTFGKSKITLRILGKTDFCEPKKDIKEDKIFIGKLDTDYRTMDLAKYIGYGAVSSNKLYLPANPPKKQESKENHQRSSILFSLLFPEEYETELIDTLFLINLFGTIGSRSGNGWGSVLVTPKSFTFNSQRVSSGYINVNKVYDDSKHYPHGLYTDAKGLLCWRTDYFTNWEDAFFEIGRVYVNLISEIKNNSNLPKNTKNLLGFAKGKKRLPGQFRMKIAINSNNQYYGMIYHIPYLIDDENFTKQEQISSGKWIHNYLDKEFSRWDSVKGGSN